MKAPINEILEALTYFTQDIEYVVIVKFSSIPDKDLEDPDPEPEK